MDCSVDWTTATIGIKVLAMKKKVRVGVSRTLTHATITRINNENIVWRWGEKKYCYCCRTTAREGGKTRGDNKYSALIHAPPPSTSSSNLLWVEVEEEISHALWCGLAKNSFSSRQQNAAGQTTLPIAYFFFQLIASLVDVIYLLVIVRVSFQISLAALLSTMYFEHVSDTINFIFYLYSYFLHSGLLNIVGGSSTLFSFIRWDLRERHIFLLKRVFIHIILILNYRIFNFFFNVILRTNWEKKKFESGAENQIFTQ